MAEVKRNPDLEWLDHVQQVGLVVAPVRLEDLGLAPERQTQVDSKAIAELIGEDASNPVIADPWRLFALITMARGKTKAESRGQPMGVLARVDRSAARDSK